MTKINGLTAEEFQAVLEYAEEHGRTWKSQLRDEWMRAATIGPLQRLRNTHGPSWLMRFELPSKG